MTTFAISRRTARRFVLGKQGLWPGRRWMGKKGTTQALRACEAVQLDPLNVVARSQDLVLHSRILDCRPEYRGSQFALAAGYRQRARTGKAAI